MGEHGSTYLTLLFCGLFCSTLSATSLMNFSLSSLSTSMTLPMINYSPYFFNHPWNNLPIASSSSPIISSSPYSSLFFNLMTFPIRLS